MTGFLNWFQQYNKAWVGLITIAVYLVNKKYGWDIPLDDDTTIALLGALVSALTYMVPNKNA